MSPNTKPTSLKRRNDNDDKDRPFKKQTVEVTGLEERTAMADMTPRTISTITTSEIGLYARRRKVAKYADVIRRKKALASKVRGDWSGMPVSSQQGLRNTTGAICYRLSLLQALLHQPLFVHWIQDYHRPEHCVSDDKEKCVACCLRRLTLEYWRDARDSARLSKMLRGMDVLFAALGWSPDRSSGHADPDEQTTWLFGVLQREMPSTIFAGLEAIIQPLFNAAICCSSCGYESRTKGHGDQALPVPIVPALRNGTLSMYLHKYMIEAIEGYRCDKCKDSTSEKHRKLFISYAPDIITIQLKRTDEYGRKLNTAITINRFLDLSRYRDAGNQETLRYELSAVIKHQGSSGFGHYICSAKGPNGDWYGFDDQRKTVTSFTAAVSSTGDFTPYLLFFQRKED